MAVDLSHVQTSVTVKGYLRHEQLTDCLKGCDLVGIPAGAPTKPGRTRDDLLNSNATVVALAAA